MAPPNRSDDQRPLRAVAPTVMRVLILGRDRQFKRMARLLFERRGALVRTGAEAADAVELVRLHRAEVLVLDVSDAVTASAQAAASVAALPAPVGVVLVGGDAGRSWGGVSVLPKWGPFEALFTEAERACRSCDAAAWRQDVAL